MVIKGSSRGNPRQLARHLLRTDQNAHVEILECDNSPKADLYEAFEDMQLLTQATKGSKGLYHAQINPDARYSLTPAQWRHAADVLAKELGLEGQPRTVVYHEKDGRPHIHVVWQRTQIDSMTLVSDSQNYRAHERASLQLERDFGHEHTPGRHAKRDPEKERPTAAFNHAAWQQFERSKLDPRQRKTEITALYHRAQNGRGFQQALQAAGYHLARGDRRALVVLDPAAEIHSLNRQITGVRSREINAKLQDLDADRLPTAIQLQSTLRDRPQPPRRAPPTPLPTPELEAETRLDAERRRLIQRLREERQKEAARWERILAEEKENFDRFLAKRRASEHAADRAPQVRSFGPFLGLWEQLQNRLDPARRDLQIRALEAREQARDTRDAQERTERASSRARWLNGQRETLRHTQTERRQAFEDQRFEELARLEQEARLRREQAERERRDRARSRDGPDRDER